MNAEFEIPITEFRRHDTIVIQFTDPKAFRYWVSMSDDFRDDFVRGFKEAKLIVLPPYMTIRVLRRAGWRYTLKNWWYVLSGERYSDRLIERAHREFDEYVKLGNAGRRGAEAGVKLRARLINEVNQVKEPS